MTEAERSILNHEHYREVFELNPPKFPQALRWALNGDIPAYQAWVGIQSSLAYVIEGYEADIPHSTTSSKSKKRTQQLLHPSGVSSRFNRPVLKRLFDDSRKTYLNARSGRSSSDAVSKLLINGKILIKDMPIGAQEPHREIFKKVFLGGFFKGLGGF